MWQVCVMCVCVCYACVCVCVYTCVHARACGPLSRGLNDAKWKPQLNLVGEQQAERKGIVKGGRRHV